MSENSYKILHSCLSAIPFSEWVGDMRHPYEIRFGKSDDARERMFCALASCLAFKVMLNDDCEIAKRLLGPNERFGDLTTNELAVRVGEYSGYIAGALEAGYVMLKMFDEAGASRSLKKIQAMNMGMYNCLNACCFLAIPSIVQVPILLGHVLSLASLASVADEQAKGRICPQIGKILCQLLEALVDSSEKSVERN